MKLIQQFLSILPLSSKIALRDFAYHVQHGSPSLPRLCEKYGSDKHGFHFYAQHYENHFRSFRRKPIKLLEIGIGGYDHPLKGGSSLRVWQHFFPSALIYGLDIHDKSAHDTRRIKTIVGDQADPGQLEAISNTYGPFDIIIDDGSHLSQHVVLSFRSLFPLLKPNGIYAVEDLQTSYWEEAFGMRWDGSSDRNALHTSMGFFKSLADGLNYVEYRDHGYKPSYFDQHVSALYFYHNLVFIQKGFNNEPFTF